MSDYLFDMYNEWLSPDQWHEGGDLSWEAFLRDVELGRFWRGE